MTRDAAYRAWAQAFPLLLNIMLHPQRYAAYGEPLAQDHLLQPPGFLILSSRSLLRFLHQCIDVQLTGQQHESDRGTVTVDTGPRASSHRRRTTNLHRFEMDRLSALREDLHANAAEVSHMCVQSFTGERERQACTSILRDANNYQRDPGSGPTAPTPTTPGSSSASACGL